MWQEKEGKDLHPKFTWLGKGSRHLGCLNGNSGDGAASIANCNALAFPDCRHSTTQCV